MDDKFEEMTEDQIDLVKVFKILVVKLPVILAATLAFGLAAFVYSSWFMRPVYSTNVKLYVNNQQGVSESIKVQGTDVTTSSTLADVYGAMIKTDRILEEVADNTELGYTTAQLSSMISASGVDGTPLLVVTVRSNYPEHAQTIANVVADIAPALIQDVAKGSSATIVDRAKLPRRPVSPNIPRVTLIGLALGLVLGAAGVLLAERFDLRIKKPSRLTERFGLPVLGTVAGGAGYDALRNNVKFSFAHSGCRRIAITGPGGEGRGAMAAGIAESIAQTGQRVLLIDGDLGDPAAGRILAPDAALGLSNVLVGDSEPDAAVKANVRKNLDVLASGDVPPDPIELLAGGDTKKIIDGFAGKYDYIIFVAPTAEDENAGALLAELADGVAVTVRMRRTTMDKIADLVGALRGGGARIVGFICGADKTGRKERDKK